MLVHHADAERRPRRCGSAIAARSPWTAIDPASGCDEPDQDLHQRRLAGAVLAQHAVDLAARAASRSTPSHATTSAEALGDAARPRRRSGRRRAGRLGGRCLGATRRRHRLGQPPPYASRLDLAELRRRSRRRRSVASTSSHRRLLLRRGVAELGPDLSSNSPTCEHAGRRPRCELAGEDLVEDRVEVVAGVELHGDLVVEVGRARRRRTAPAHIVMMPSSLASSTTASWEPPRYG